MSLTVLTPDEQLTKLAKPSVMNIDHFILGRNDLLIACAGFEDRALAVLRDASSGGASFTVLLSV